MCLLFAVFALACGGSAREPANVEWKGEAPLLDKGTLFEKGEKGYFCYRIPALAISTKGTILAFA